MADGAGLAQLLKAIGEMARGILVPSVKPVWERELLMARDPPHATCVDHGYEEVPSTNVKSKGDRDMIHGQFFFGPAEMSTLRNHVPSHLRNCSTFDIVTACLWRSRTIALGKYKSSDEVCMDILVNARNKLHPPLPAGYYGNAVSIPAATAGARELCENPLGYALELVKNAKENVTNEHMRSLADYHGLKGQPTNKTYVGSCIVSDVRHLGLEDVDFGWGKPVYGGPSNVDLEGIFGSFYLKMENDKGENGLLATLSLPKPSEETFLMQLEKLTRGPSAPKGVWTATEPKFRGGKAYNTKRNFNTFGKVL